ncbi:RING/FYVE/PHD zinc finger superfamily protein [Forsythia ovata]|uniref:RING/FYVE/PHD zinc finger superfamily protein n=1 Tax=Forsythia ovata TaxID=205694 RepID=A0ABD1S2A8_9LAMI
MDQELSGSREINLHVNQNIAVDHSSNSAHDSEAHITIEPNETAEFNKKSNGSTPNKAVLVDESAKVKEEDNCSSCAIDVKCVDAGDNGSFVGESERVCRICHLNAKESGKCATDLMEIGCGCKGELGIAHSECAEAWFRVKGHRLCEICGETATNITGVCNNRFMEEWNERRSTDASTNSSDGSRRCLNGQPLCNFLMACLVIAFVLPWFFRVNMF